MDDSKTVRKNEIYLYITCNIKWRKTMIEYYVYSNLFIKLKKYMCMYICISLYEHRESYGRTLKVDYFYGGEIGWGWRDDYLYINFKLLK